MDEKRNFASVTTVPCACGVLEQMAEQGRGIVFDEQMGEFHIPFVGPEGRGQGHSVIYHCPFCGGAAPESKRHLLFAAIDPIAAELLAARLGLAKITTIRQALRRLGKPDRDERGMHILPERDGRLPEAHWKRVLIYEKLSETVNVCVSENDKGRVKCHLAGKYIGNGSKNDI